MEKRNFEFDCSTFTDTELKQIREEIKKELESREFVKKEKAWFAIAEAIRNYDAEIGVYSSNGYYLGVANIGNLGEIRVIEDC